MLSLLDCLFGCLLGCCVGLFAGGLLEVAAVVWLLSTGWAACNCLIADCLLGCCSTAAGLLLGCCLNAVGGLAGLATQAAVGTDCGALTGASAGRAEVFFFFLRLNNF